MNSKLKDAVISFGMGAALGAIVLFVGVTVYEVFQCRNAVADLTDVVADVQAQQERDIQNDDVQQHIEENNKRYMEELDMLARCVEAEAGNQSLDVKRAVIAVIMNRVDDDDSPDTISEVIADPYEFATYWNGKMDEVTPSDETYEAIRMEMQTRSYPGLYYFDMDKYLLYGTPYAKMGDLYFSTK